MMLGIVRPKFFLPIHGEYRQQKRHADLAEFAGIAPSNIFILENGSVLEMDKNSAKLTGTVQAGRVFVDGLGVGDVGNIVLRDRRHLAKDGLIVIVATFDADTGQLVSGPDLISRGFVYVRESSVLMEEARAIVRNIILKCEEKHMTDWAAIKAQVKEALSKFLYDKTKLNPMILPVIMEV